MTPVTGPVQRFALVREPNDPGSVVGYGLVLPDGSAISVSWPADRGSTYYRTTSAQAAANLRGADLILLDDPA